MGAPVLALTWPLSLRACPLPTVASLYAVHPKQRRMRLGSAAGRYSAEAVGWGTSVVRIFFACLSMLSVCIFATALFMLVVETGYPFVFREYRVS